MAETAKEDNLLIAVTSEEKLKPKIAYLKPIIQASQVIRMWPNTDERKKHFHKLVVIMITINCIIFILTFSFRIQKDYKNMDGITEMIDFVTVLISGTFRYLYVQARGNEYLKLVDTMHNNFIHYPFFVGKSTASLDKHYTTAKRIILTYSCFTFFWILQVCSIPILRYLWITFHSGVTAGGLNETDTHVEIPYPIIMNVYVPFDVYTQPNNALFYAYQAVGFLIFGIIYVAVDCFWYMIILLTIGQFDLIKHSLNTLTEILNGDTANETYLLEKSQIEEVEQGLTKCIKHHQFTRSFVRKIEDINNPNVLVDNLHAVISIGFILLDITIALNSGDWNKVLYSFEYLITSVVHMFFIDWLGNELAFREEELAEAIYEIPWYKCPTQKGSFLLFTIQSRRPYRMTGGKMYKLSLEFFTSTMRAVFSYFTFLFQMLNGKPNRA